MEKASPVKVPSVRRFRKSLRAILRPCPDISSNGIQQRYLGLNYSVGHKKTSAKMDSNKWSESHTVSWPITVLSAVCKDGLGVGGFKAGDLLSKGEGSSEKKTRLFLDAGDFPMFLGWMVDGREEDMPPKGRSEKSGSQGKRAEGEDEKTQIHWCCGQIRDHVNLVS